MLLNAARELAWLTRHWKAAPLPLVAYDPALSYSGMYVWPTLQSVRVGGVEFIVPEGAIVLGTDPGPGTLSHEYRHHLQRLARGNVNWDSPDPEQASIAEYFRCPFERDALGFELRFAPEDVALGFAEVAKVRVPSRAELLGRVYAGGRAI